MKMEDGAPLYGALKSRAERSAARFHMPGHKGKVPGGFDAFALDFTELEDTGNLYLDSDGEGPIRQAEQSFARACGARHSFFLTGGSTMGMHAALASVCRPGDRVLLDRACHRCVISACVLLDLRPEYLYPELLPVFGVPAGVSSAALEEKLKSIALPKAFVMTSPTYCGVLSDISAISHICGKYGVSLIVDEAHGAHLPFITQRPCAAALGADISVMSAHKTLPALGQSAVINSSGRINSSQIRRNMAIFGTSSPSYAIMASLDFARLSMECRGRELYKQAAAAARRITDGVNRRGVFRALDGSGLFGKDDCRVCVCTGAGGLSGRRAAEILENEHGIACEMADERNVVFIVTGNDTPEELSALDAALEALESLFAGESLEFETRVPQTDAEMTPREAFFSEIEEAELASSLGRISGQIIALFPPGIPIIAPGERIDEKMLSFLKTMGYNVKSNIQVIKKPL